MKKPVNPFPTSGYYGVAYFCDRVKETSSLLDNLQSGQSTVLVSIRRIGKTGLIKHLLTQLPKGWLGIYIDILPSENLNDFLNAMSTAIINAIPEKSAPGAKIWKFIKSLRPTIHFDPLTGNPQVTFELKTRETEQQIDSLFHFLEKYNKKVLIAIDEFQQILNYPEKNTDAWLRSIIQHLKNIVFIFSGSHQHLMNELFISPSRPFFRSTSFMKLKKIPEPEYASFIHKKFTDHNRQIPEEVTEQILKWTNCHTFYVQMLCSRIFMAPYEDITTPIWQDEAFRLLKEQEPVFYNYRDLLTKPQWQLLKAIAREGMVYAPTSKDFIALHSLGSPATVLRSLKTLIKKELLFFERDTDGKGYYSVYDVFFQRWIEHI